MGDEHEDGEKVTHMDKKRKNRHGSVSDSTISKDAKEGRGKKQKKPKTETKDQKKALEEGYIHVRARRGQATDSHSLAERVRREKISARMKLLQGLVPGCDKVTGKALMLDEIINYVQSLQNQVEFLSMKLASANPMFSDFGVEPDTFMVRQEMLSSLAMGSPPLLSDAVPTLGTAASNNYPLLDSSASFTLQQSHNINTFSQDDGNLLLWDVDELHRQSPIYQSGMSSDMGSFH